MTDAEFFAKLEQAASIVRDWPAWKRGVLMQSLQPTVERRVEEGEVTSDLDYGSCDECKEDANTQS